MICRGPVGVLDMIPRSFRSLIDGIFGVSSRETPIETPTTVAMAIV